MTERAQIDTPLKLGRAAAANAPARHLPALPYPRFAHAHAIAVSE